jgi:hypothetical protein
LGGGRRAYKRGPGLRFLTHSPSEDSRPPPPNNLVLHIEALHSSRPATIIILYSNLVPWGGSARGGSVLRLMAPDWLALSQEEDQQKLTMNHLKRRILKSMADAHQIRYSQTAWSCGTNPSAMNHGRL